VAGIDRGEGRVQGHAPRRQTRFPGPAPKNPGGRAGWEVAHREPQIRVTEGTVVGSREGVHTPDCRGRRTAKEKRWSADLAAQARWFSFPGAPAWAHGADLDGFRERAGPPTPAGARKPREGHQRHFGAGPPAAGTIQPEGAPAGPGPGWRENPSGRNNCGSIRRSGPGGRAVVMMIQVVTQGNQPRPPSTSRVRGRKPGGDGGPSPHAGHGMHRREPPEGVIAPHQRGQLLQQTTRCPGPQASPAPSPTPARRAVIRQCALTSGVAGAGTPHAIALAPGRGPR